MKNITSNSKLKVAITVNSEQDRLPSIWSSGAWQNVIFLYYLLGQSERIESVKLLNHAVNPSKQLQIVKGTSVPLFTFNEIQDDVDVVIIMGIQLGGELTQILRNKGVKVICFHVGNHYIISLENILFNLNRGGGDFDGAQLDGVWTLPHHANTCLDFFEVINKAPVEVLPYIWNALFIQHMIETNYLTDKFGYKAKDKHKIAIFEPNINIVKTSIYPLLISELAYRQRPDLIGGVHVTNTAKFYKQENFNKFAYTLDITKNGIASYDDRYDTPSFLSLFADIVLTHQWENGLNNLYFDVLYGQYPLVHNSPFLKSVGYYYEGFNAKQGAQELIRALTQHNAEEYQQTCARAIYDVDIYNPENIKQYEEKLFKLFGV